MKSFNKSPVLVALISAIAGSVTHAATRYAVVDGSTEIVIDREAMVEHGLTISTDSRGSEFIVDKPIRFDIAGTTEIAIDDEFKLIGDSILHDGNLLIATNSASVEMTNFAIRVDDRDKFAMTVIDAKTGTSLLVAHEIRGAFGASAAMLNAEVAQLRISPALAKMLGDESLAGVSIGSLRMRSAFIVTESDGPTPVAVPALGGGFPRGATGADVIVGDLPSISNYSSVNGIEAFAVGTTSCNLGDVPLQWIDENLSNLHPVIGQNLFRYRQLADGSSRFEQIGQAWLKHGFCALQGTVCGPCTPFPGGCADHLGVGCSDPYSSSLNGTQDGLGPKYEVNPHSGVFSEPYSHGDQGATGDATYKRLQVAIDDINPAIIGSAQFFVEGQYVAQDDAAAGNQNNNASYRRIGITGSGSAWTFSTSGQPATQREQAGIRAWQDTDAGVVEADAQVPGDGLFIVAAEVTDLGNGIFHYEYAVQNLNADRAGGSFTVPVSSGAQVFNVEFHDVSYHSGEPYDGTDWSVSIDPTSVTWTTESFATNADANALRWGTMYNFRFDTNATSANNAVTIGLFKPGSPSSASANLPTPTGGVNVVDCNNNGIDDMEDIANLTSADCNGNNIPDECEATCELTTIRVATGLSSPVFVAAPSGDFDRLFIVEQTGGVRILNLVSNQLLPQAFLDLSGGQISSGGERGLFAIAFHPDYANNRRFFVSYTNPAGNSVLAEYLASVGNPNVADAGSATIIRTVNQDFSNHNGGQIQFGPDGMLYWSLGDGGSANDPNERAQNNASPLGKMHRFDVDNLPSYVAADNPGGGFLADVWAKGLRNPWRFSFDRLTGDMYIGDVGQDAREEIDFQPASSTGGENYGWDCREGDIATPPPGAGDAGCDPNAGGYVDPIRVEEHGQSGTCSITGGYVYRGCDIPWLSGTYFYADFCGNYIRTFTYDGSIVQDGDIVNRAGDLQPIGGGSITSITGFGEDARGELYIVSGAGSVYKIICNDPNAAVCGNGLIEPGEQCENPDGAVCDCECQTQPLVCAADLINDNFETDMGWTTSASIGTTSGFWQRGVPVNNAQWDFDPVSDFDGSGQCYLTENSNANNGNTDIDGGSVTLTSPLIDTTGSIISVSYAYYLNLNVLDGGDNLLVELSNNGDAGPWFTIANHTTNGALTWRTVNIAPGALAAAGFTPSANTKIRFTATDGGQASVVEAGVDAFRVCRVQVDDCNLNCVDDADDIANLTSFDCNDNGIPDECEVGVTPCDCNENGINDAIDLANMTGADCNDNGILDECDIAATPDIDCDGGPVGDPVAGGQLLVMFCAGCHNNDGSGGMGFPGPNIRNRPRDFIWNRILPPTDHPGGQFGIFTQQDFANLAEFLSDSAGSRGRPDMIPDSCQSLTDCDNDSTTDGCELENGTQQDTDFDGVPDDCTTGCPGPADGDINGDTLVNGEDISAFMTALFGTPTPAEVCAGDFSSNQTLGVEDVTGFANALIAP